jgi:hypothetical protein
MMLVYYEIDTIPLYDDRVSTNIIVNWQQILRFADTRNPAQSKQLSVNSQNAL